MNYSMESLKQWPTKYWDSTSSYDTQLSLFYFFLSFNIRDNAVTIFFKSRIPGLQTVGLFEQNAI